MYLAFLHLILSNCLAVPDQKLNGWNIDCYINQVLTTLTLFFFFVVTPFKNGTSLNQSLPVSQQKAKFDLKASLSRPMTWKPHTGKVRPFQQENLYSQKAGAFRVDPKNMNIKVQSK